MMTKENMTFAEETKKFNQAVDLFFSNNPAERYWILLALYFAKSKNLCIIDNYDGCKNGFCIAFANYPLNSHKSDRTECNEGNILIRSVVAYYKDEERDFIDEMPYNLRVDAIEYQSSVKGQKLDYFCDSIVQPTYLIDVAEILISLSEEWYKENGQWAFETIAKRALREEEKSKRLFFQPAELTKLMVDLLDAQSGKVYNPYAGNCAFGIALNDNCEYIAEEPSSNFMLGQLALLYNGKTNSYCFRNSFCNQNDCDYIIGIPPFGVREKINNYETTEKEYLYRSAENTRHKAIGLYPLNICFSGSKISPNNNRILDLIENDYIEGVILLPSNIVPSVIKETVIIIVNKKKTNKNHIRFVDARDLCEKTGKLNRLLTDQIIKRYNTDGKKSKNVPLSKIEETGYKLYPKLYLSKGFRVPNGMREISLSEVLTPLSLKHIRRRKGRILSFSDKGFMEAAGIINSNDLEISNFDYRDFGAINRDCLVMHHGRSFSIKYLITNGKDIFMRPSNTPFLVDTKKIAPIYLLAELSKDYVKMQLFLYGMDIRGTRISIEDFLNLKILVPLLREQQVKMSLDSIKNNIDTIENQKDIEYKNKLESFILNQRQRKHAITQVLNEIIPSVENIESFILNNETVSKDSVVSRRFGTTLETYLASVRTQLDKVATMVDNFTNKEEYGIPSDIPIEEFLPKYCESKRALGINVEYRHHYEVEEIVQYVKISEKDLTQMLDNLITNAVKYGKNEENDKIFQILIETSAIHYDREPVIIKISNNGELVSKSISLDKLFTWGIGNGSGIGCWQVKEIAEHYGGYVSYQEYDDDPEGFACEFCIALPLNED